MKKNHSKTSLIIKLGGLSFILSSLCIAVLNSSCSSDLYEIERNESITRSAFLEHETEDSVLTHIKTISSRSYILTYTDSIVNEKNISRDSAYFEYLQQKYLYLINNFYNNKKYDSIDPPLFLMEQENVDKNSFTRIAIDDIIIEGSIGVHAQKCLRRIRSSVVHCPQYMDGGMCCKIMMRYAYDILSWIDTPTHAFVSWIYGTSDGFTRDYMSNVAPSENVSPVNSSALLERFNVLLRMTNIMHPQFCPNPDPDTGGGSSSGGNSSGGSSSGGRQTQIHMSRV